MTAYFDQKHSQVRAFKETGSPDCRPLDEIENSMVYDVTLASESPGFPEDLRDEINRLILRRGVASLPLNSKRKPAFDTDEELFECVHSLIWDVHSIFHELARREIDGFSDDPRTPMRAVFSRGEERREAMAEAEPATGAEE